jgi:hypothetical protein
MERNNKMQQHPHDTRPRAGAQVADDAGEDDLAYFTARPEARTRIRAAFDGEFPRKILKQGAGRQAVVIVAVERNSAGEPTTRARGVLFPEGGAA